jgi:hypothetical protein
MCVDDVVVQQLDVRTSTVAARLVWPYERTPVLVLEVAAPRVQALAEPSALRVS